MAMCNTVFKNILLYVLFGSNFLFLLIKIIYANHGKYKHIHRKSLINLDIFTSNLLWGGAECVDILT